MDGEVYDEVDNSARSFHINNDGELKGSIGFNSSQIALF